MRRLSRPQSSDSLLGSPPQWDLSPVPQPEPDQAARTDSATPSILYRSSFAQECEAVVFQLSSAAEEVRPRRPLTIQEETLTPLEPPCSFLDSPDGRPPSPPGPEAASASAGPPDPFATVVLCSEQSAGPAGISFDVVAQLAASSSASALAGVSSRPELEKGSPTPNGANVTYECSSSSSSSGNATYICTGSPSPEEKGTLEDAASAQPALGVCTRELPFVTSTPLMAPSLPKETPPTTLGTECSGKRAASGSGSKQKPPPDRQGESGFRVSIVSSRSSLSAAANDGADRVPRASGRAPFAKNSLSLGTSRALRARGAPGIGGLPKGTGAARKIPQPTGRNFSQNLVMPQSRSGSAVQSQLVTPKLSSDETTKTDLTEVPCNKKPPISIQPPSKLAGRFGVQGSLACLGLKFHDAPKDNNTSGTRLPVFAGNKVTAKTSSQKRPWEKSSDKATVSPLKQPFPKRSRLSKSQKEKPTQMAVGYTPSATLKELSAPCSQCQRLAEENQQLRSMLETYQKTIAFLEGKQTVVENENCPPQTEAT